MRPKLVLTILGGKDRNRPYQLCNVHASAQLIQNIAFMPLFVTL